MADGDAPTRDLATIKFQTDERLRYEEQKLAFLRANVADTQAIATRMVWAVFLQQLAAVDGSLLSTQKKNLMFQQTGRHAECVSGLAV